VTRPRLLVGHDLGLIAVFMLIIIVGAVASPYFLTVDNLTTIVTSASIIGIISVGMTFVIIGGGIDLSVGAIVALAGVWATTNVNQSLGAVDMLFVAILVGGLVGVVNGTLIAYGNIVPFIATLAILVSARGLAQHISGGVPQTVTVNAFNALGSGTIAGLPVPVWVFAAVVAIGWFVLNRTTFGRRTVAIGGNPEASRLVGIDVRRHTLALYVLSGICAGIAGALLAARLTSGSNAVGNLYELNSIAAVIIGGTRLSGGRGSIAGSIVGVLIFTMIGNIFVLRNLQTDVQSIAQGIIIIVAVLLQSRGGRSR